MFLVFTDVVGLTNEWPPACTRVVCSWSGWDENLHLQIWGVDSQQGNGGMLSLGQRWIVGPREGVRVSQGLVHKWGESGAEDWQTDWHSICSTADIALACCGKHLSAWLQTFSSSPQWFYFRVTVAITLKSLCAGFIIALCCCIHT